MLIGETSTRYKFRQLSRKLLPRGWRQHSNKSLWRQDWLKKITSILTPSSHRLLNLAEVKAACTILGYAYVGTQTVSIHQIRGSATQGRCHDFDADFRPRKKHNLSRWQGISAARRRGTKLPPVGLIQVGDIYFVEDGHHRISVARSLGDQEIEAHVTQWKILGQLPWQ